jgi:cytochrome c biogenesis factor
MAATPSLTFRMNRYWWNCEIYVSKLTSKVGRIFRQSHCNIAKGKNIMLQYRFYCMYISGCVENVAIQLPTKGKKNRSDDKPRFFSVTILHLQYTVFMFGQDIYHSENSVRYNSQVIAEIQKLNFTLQKYSVTCLKRKQNITENCLQRKIWSPKYPNCKHLYWIKHVRKGKRLVPCCSVIGRFHSNNLVSTLK